MDKNLILLDYSQISALKGFTTFGPGLPTTVVQHICKQVCPWFPIKYNQETFELASLEI
jgi:hypothetical protein